MSCECDQCAGCFTTVAQYERMDIIRLKSGAEVCAHPGNCTQKVLARNPNARVTKHNVRADQGAVLPATLSARGDSRSPAPPIPTLAVVT